jgi:hypothetical protein
MALSTSPAIAEASATRSWLSRLSERTRRPHSRAGSSTSSSTPSTCAITQGLVSTSMTSAPAAISALRRPMLKEEPITVCTSVVSVVRRDSTSPVRVVSKKPGAWRITRAYTAERTSAVMRSPSQVTR